MLSLVTANIWRAVFLASLAIIAALSAHIWGVPIIGGGLVEKLETARTERDGFKDERDRLIAEGDRRTKAGKAALQEAQSKRPVVDSQIARIRAEAGSGGDSCATPEAVLSADL